MCDSFVKKKSKSKKKTQKKRKIKQKAIIFNFFILLLFEKKKISFKICLCLGTMSLARAEKKLEKRKVFFVQKISKTVKTLKINFIN